MLRNIMLISQSGIVLFTKEFVRGVENPRMIGALLSAMFARVSDLTGLPFRYIELKNGA
jgi:hypothetical protein